ncbi:hypothetical protein [Rossellomorea marisflavi]|uniref:hypothetical protein n=1 Tax=Rossellomorea marisflavi TaxID=189381 RepID=UPI003F9F8587
MEENKGLTGWLSPEGVFHECEYGEHYNLASELMDAIDSKVVSDKRIELYEKKGSIVHSERVLLEEMIWIPMGGSENGNSRGKDYLFINYLIGVTQKQKDWFAGNKDKLSANQLKQLEEALEDLEEMEDSK